MTRFGWVLPAGYVKADASAPTPHSHHGSHAGHEASFEVSAQRMPAAAAMISSPSPSRKD